MVPEICVRLDRLTADPTGPAMKGAYRLALGLSQDVADDEWLPPDYPFEPNEAVRFLRDLQQMPLAELEAMHLALGRENIGTELQERQELADLARFSGRQPATTPWELARQHAHKLLIWLYHREQQLLEIAELERKCLAVESIIPHNFSEFDFAQIPVDPPGSAAPEDSLWRITAAQAVLFIPLDLPILVEGEMRLELLDRLDFQPHDFCDTELLSCSAPFWRVLGMSSPYSHRVLEELRSVYNESRLWLAHP